MKKRSHNHNATEDSDCYPTTSMRNINDGNKNNNDNEIINQLSPLSLPSLLQQMFYKDRNMTPTAIRHRRIIIFLTIVGGISIVCCVLVGIITIPLHVIEGGRGTSSTSTSTSGSSIYKGTPWFNNERTISVKTIGETKFARCDIHTVKSEKPGDDSNVNIINDWLFLEELDAVNIAVMMTNTLDGSMIFPVFEQNKYAIPGASLSPVGGMIDHDNESPLECAKREVFEELGLGSPKTKQQIDTVIKSKNMKINTNNNGKSSSSSSDDDDDDTITMKAFTLIPKMKRIVDEYNLAIGDDNDDDQDKDWIFLGRYRSAANRGAGFAYTYLLKNAVPILNNGGTPAFKLSTGDDEYQKIKLLSKNEIKSALITGKFQEVKWTTTYALSLLHLDSSTSTTTTTTVQKKGEIK